MFCPKCGQEINNDAVICVHCGCATQNVPMQPEVSEEPAGCGLQILSFLFPIIGIVLYVVNKDKKPVSAKSCLKIALISWGIAIVVGIVFGVLSVLARTGSYV